MLFNKTCLFVTVKLKYGTHLNKCFKNAGEFKLLVRLVDNDFFATRLNQLLWRKSHKHRKYLYRIFRKEVTTIM